MSELPVALSAVALSAVALRLAGEAGQTALNEISVSGVAAGADLDQHMAATRFELTGCPSAEVAQIAGLAAARAGIAQRDQAAARAAAPSRSGAASAIAPAARLAPVACPDVPFTGTALRAEPALPLRLLLHYTCGFVEGAVTADWWPAAAPSGPVDWESMRLAALCELISQAEAAAELHPDLRVSP